MSKVQLSENQIKREEAYETFGFFYTQISFLEGKLLTVVDASYSDREQREAIKSLVKKEVRSWGDWVHSLIIDRVAPSDIPSVNMENMPSEPGVVR